MLLIFSGVLLDSTAVMNNFYASYKRILRVLQTISEKQLLAYQRRTLKWSNLELLAVNLTAEYISVDSENNWFRKLPKLLTYTTERNVFN